MPVGYFGGKNRMSPWIYSYIPRDIKTYVEVFSGAFWVYLNTNTDYTHVNKIVYNDINKDMVNLVASCKEYDKFDNYIENEIDNGILKPVGKFEEFYKELYYKYKNSELKLKENFNVPDFDEAVKYGFLLTSAFNSCHYTAAGFSGFNKSKTETKIKLYSLLNKLRDEKYQEKFKNITEFNNLDFEKLIEKYDSEDTFLYCDPPYADLKNNRLKWYGVEDESIFGPSSHIRLLNLLKRTKSRWALSYYYFPELETMLPKDEYTWISKEFFRSSASFSDNKDVKGEELLIMNYKLTDEEIEYNKSFLVTKKNKKSKIIKPETKPEMKPDNKKMTSSNFWD